jgi:hypothetical protein
MEENFGISFIKMDNNIAVNKMYIRWIRKVNDCIEVCSKQTGCDMTKQNIINSTDTLKICRVNNPENFDKLNQIFIDK